MRTANARYETETDALTRDSIARLHICSPKLIKARDGKCNNWTDFFPYYAGFSEDFTRHILASAKLTNESLIWDPWNGSGTTTYVSSRLGLSAVGNDLNPAMTIMAKARNLRHCELQAMHNAWEEAKRHASQLVHTARDNDPLLKWFTARSASVIRSVATAVYRQNLPFKKNNSGEIVPAISAIYIALGMTCRATLAQFRTSNPTWIRSRRAGEKRISCDLDSLLGRIDRQLAKMTASLSSQNPEEQPENGSISINVADSTSNTLPAGSTDFVLTSPPYCTRIDYTAATAVELALLSPQLKAKTTDLSRMMLGTTKAPKRMIERRPTWGTTCLSFLDAIARHPSKDSSGYYFATHLDYFDKLERSIENIAATLKIGARAIFVVQDSYYKDLHNDLPTILSEMAQHHGLVLHRRDNFVQPTSLLRSNRFSRIYKRPPSPTEAVLCFSKSANARRAPYTEETGCYITRKRQLRTTAA